MRYHLLATAVVVSAVALPALPAQESAAAITLERIMADPEWIARSPEDAYWAADGASVYWTQKRAGSELTDLVETGLDGVERRRVADDTRHTADVDGGDWSIDRTRRVYERNGDLFLTRFVPDGSATTTQLTRTVATEREPFFVRGSDAIAFRRDGAWIVRALEDGLEWQPLDVRSGSDPDAAPKAEPEFVVADNRRLEAPLRDAAQRDEERKQAARAQRLADPTRAPAPFFLGDGVVVHDVVPAADLRHAVVVFGPADQAGRRDSMPVWITESGYVEPRDVRPLVGSGRSGGVRLALLDLDAHRLVEVDLSTLPGIAEHPLDAIRAANRAADDGSAVPAPTTGPRAVAIWRVEWNEAGTQCAFQARSVDNKDRWTAVLACSAAATVADGQKLAPAVVERLHDDAWVGGPGQGLGWLDETRLWFQSEASGFCHVWFHDTATGATEQVTSGAWETSAAEPDPTNRFLFVRANRTHPGITEILRLDVASRELVAITALGGMNSARLSPDGAMLLITHSTALEPPELYVQPAEPGVAATRLTTTVTPEWRALPWIAPRFVTIPNEDDQPIHARLYVPPTPVEHPRPAVLFVHGAGYLQNAHQGWSSYFREFMFHALLAHRGFVVLDMDYRASAGYGRDWRTAIYRQMGTPELADLKSGVAWLGAHADVDVARVGVYGGSYGGFMTLMALFKSPGTFRAGAALRPVTDWAHYNHGYTSNILNTPADDPEAYRRSSPIEFADGLRDRLLICHGMLDDNVFFKDTVRLVQRLIDLEKTGWECAMYPVEPHGFRRPSSWLDEYRRILALFESTLR